MKLSTRNALRHDAGPSNERDTLIMLGAGALVVIGWNRAVQSSVRWYVEQSPLKNILGNLVPDVERYF